MHRLRSVRSCLSRFGDLRARRSSGKVVALRAVERDLLRSLDFARSRRFHQVPPVDWGWLITPDELSSWILLRTDDLLVLNKPPHTVCHPSRYGPWSSLIGACREYLGVERLHMPFRLDRETSGVLVFAQTRETGVRLQHAVMLSQVQKEYIAIVEGNVDCARTVSEPIGPD